MCKYETHIHEHNVIACSELKRFTMLHGEINTRVSLASGGEMELQLISLMRSCPLMPQQAKNTREFQTKQFRLKRMKHTTVRASEKASRHRNYFHSAHLDPLRSFRGSAPHSYHIWPSHWNDNHWVVEQDIHDNVALNPSSAVSSVVCGSLSS